LLSKVLPKVYGDKLTAAGDPDAPLYQKAIPEIDEVSEPELLLERFVQPVTARARRTSREDK
jgi:hypothetical protein